MSMTIYADARGGQILEEAENTVKCLQSLLSAMKNDSDISHINNAGGQWVEVCADTDEILQKAVYFAQKTDGAYEPAILPLARLWDIKSKIREKERASLPDEISIRKVLGACDWRNIETDG
ncbi:MAG: FAD:protein FMN transferase, partial [Endomicrobium sp.]|nr:FAD:protein FMN transferase [Endomicrobium sp.]